MLFKAKSQCLQPLDNSRDNLHKSLDVVSLLASTSCDLTYKGIQICYKLSTYLPYTPEIFWQSWSYQSNSNFQCLLKVLLDKYRLTTTRQLFVGIEIDGDVCVSRWRQRMIDTFNTYCWSKNKLGDVISPIWNYEWLNHWLTHWLTGVSARKCF